MRWLQKTSSSGTASPQPSLGSTSLNGGSMQGFGSDSFRRSGSGGSNLAPTILTPGLGVASSSTRGERKDLNKFLADSSEETEGDSEESSSDEESTSEEEEDGDEEESSDSSEEV